MLAVNPENALGPPPLPPIRTFLHYQFDPKRAQRAIKFIERFCVLFEGQFAGKPIKLRPWQRHMIGELFGWFDPATGLRRYRKAFWFLPKKNGKSSLIAGIGLYMLIADRENGPQVILASNSREQSGNVFRPACGMVEQSPDLLEVCTVLASTKRILHPESNGFLAVVSAEAKTIQGLSPSCLIYDEIADAPTRDLYDKLTSASKTRTQPLQIFITTAGSDNQGIGYELYKYAKNVLADPESDPTFYSVIYELGADEDWTLEENWFKVNPALGDFNQLADMRAEFREALSSTSAAGKFKMYSLNQWISAAKAWLNVDKWAKCAAPTFDVSSLKPKPCYMGLDLSKNTDLTAVAALWRLDPKKYYLKVFFFLPDEDLRGRVIRDHVPYDAWVENGHVTLIPGPRVDYAFVKKHIDEFRKDNDVKMIGYDDWQAKDLVNDLEKEGATMVTVRQGHQSLGAPSKEFESLIISGDILHDNNPCMNWQIGNVAVRLDQNANIVPDKKRSMHRIDGVMASLDALYCAMKIEEQTPPLAELRLHVLG